MATTVEVPAEFVPYLKSAAIYTLGEEAGRVHDGEKKVWEVELPEKVALAEDDLNNVRPFLDLMMPLAQEILPLPDENPELAGAFGWASTESVRLEKERLAEIKRNKGEAD